MFLLRDLKCTFSEHRQRILDRMIYYRNKIKPDVVFIPSLDDQHQDHEIVRNEAIGHLKTVQFWDMNFPGTISVLIPSFFSI